MNHIKTIFMKEMRRVFTDKRMVIGLYIPGILIFIIYTIFGSTMQNVAGSVVEKPTNQKIHITYTDNSGKDMPRIINGMFLSLTGGESNNEVITEKIPTSKVEQAKENLLAKKTDLLIQFSNDFENKFNLDGDPSKNYVALFYNAEVGKSAYVYNLGISILDSVYKNYQVNIIDNKPVQSNVAKGDAVVNKVMAMIFPVVTVSLLFSTVIGICPESIAGEKERGTFASVLLTPVKRSQIVIGKILALTVVGLSSGIVSFLGIFFSLPKLINSSGISNMGISVGSGIALFFSIMTLLLFFIALATLVSTVCKSVKEATNYMGPCMVIFMMIAVASMFLDTSHIACSFVPVLNVVSYMTQLIGNTNANLTLFFTFTIISNAIYTALAILLTAKLFTKEKVMIPQ